MTDVSTTFDIGRIKRDLVENSPEAWQWLADTWQTPDPFLQDVLVHHAQHHDLGCGTVLGESIALVDDLVLRHELRVDPAFVGPDGQTTSYRQLAGLVGQRSRYFQRRGVETGSVVAVVVSDPLALASGVLAVWSLGAIVSFIAPWGPRYVRVRLEHLAPDFLVSNYDTRPWLAQLRPEQCLSASGATAGPTAPGAPHAYGPQDPVARLFSPFSADPREPVELTAKACMAGAIRDGLLVLDLRPGQVVSAPSLDPGRHEPALLMAGLLAGATRRIGPPPRSRREQETLLRADVVGLTGAQCRDAAEGKLDLRRAKRWFCPLDEPLDVLALQQTAKHLLERKLPGTMTLGCAAAGGTFAWAPRPRDPGLLNMVPLPGLAHTLDEPAAPGIDAASAGVLTCHELDPAATGRFIFGRHHQQLYFGGAMVPTRGGETFLHREVEDIVEELVQVEAAVAVRLPGRLPNDGHLHLLVFVDPRGEPTELGLDQLIEAQLKFELGPGVPPLTIEVFPLIAPGAGGEPDRVQCEIQYVQGQLHRRRADPLFREMARLRRVLIDLNDQSEAKL